MPLIPFVLSLPIFAFFMQFLTHIRFYIVVVISGYGMFCVKLIKNDVFLTIIAQHNKPLYPSSFSFLSVDKELVNDSISFNLYSVNVSLHA